VADHYVTLMIISQPSAKVSTVRVRRSVLVGLGVLLVAVLGVSSVLAGIGVQQWVRRADLGALQARNDILGEELTGLQESLGRYQAQMEEHVVLEERLRLLANLDPIPAEVRLMGVGGSEEYTPSYTQGLAIGERAHLSHVTGRVEQLLRQARLERESLEQIHEALVSDRVKWAHTPSIRPVGTGYISSGFGKRIDPFTGKLSMHWGVDFCTWEGEPVYATADGRVRKAHRDGGLGRVVVIDHGNGYVTRYAHNSEIKVTQGQEVRRGDVIALVGRSGRATAPHLHYEVRLNGKPINPMSFILPSDHIVD